ncbi:hypothetical protein [Serratia symbiotica]|uniref:hypothetical protein n=1 Tax=Serratia symbiotica TaxID=138074 RepID=UPI003CC8B787
MAREGVEIDIKLLNGGWAMHDALGTVDDDRHSCACTMRQGDGLRQIRVADWYRSAA